MSGDSRIRRSLGWLSPHVDFSYGPSPDCVSDTRSSSSLCTLAKQLDDKNSLALALQNATTVAIRECDPAKVERFSSELIELSTRHEFFVLANGRNHVPRLGVQRFR
jgi:hypothetical protein